jgi:hypothetical protein
LNIVDLRWGDCGLIGDLELTIGDSLAISDSASVLNRTIGNQILNHQSDRQSPIDNPQSIRQSPISNPKML